MLLAAAEGLQNLARGRQARDRQARTAWRGRIMQPNDRTVVEGLHNLARGRQARDHAGPRSRRMRTRPEVVSCG